MGSRPKCADDAACERLWSAARNWVIGNCSMKIQNITDSYIETFNSVGGSPGLHCRVVKDPLPEGGYILTITTGCANMFGCVPDAWDAALNFNRAVQGAAPYEPAPAWAKQAASGASVPLAASAAVPMAKLPDDPQAQELAFLARNAARAGVETTASGLQYEVIYHGTGALPSASSTVRVHYVGRLSNGEKFDSSRDRRQPAEFALDQVIEGWREGLQLMKVGSTYRLFVPSRLAYGATGGGSGAIGPYEALVFEIELLDVLSSPAPAVP